jgi:beta-glucanase (GH16 family)
MKIKYLSALCLALICSACSTFYLVQKPDLYKTGEETYEEDLTPPGDKGFKSTLEREGWKLVWQDEFDAATLDTTKWSYEINGDGGGNNELQYYIKSPANSYMRDGKFVIKGMKENYKGKLFTSARVNTRYKAGWKYGRFDIRARTPVQQGVWPAIWMLPTDYVYGGWPQSGEIDIMESIGNKPSTLHGTLHYGQPWPNNKNIGGQLELPKGTTFEDAYHVFSCEWEENVIRFYMDDSLYATRTPADLAPQPWPFDQTFHMILNLAIGGNWPGPPDETTTFPKYMFVDYVRVYERKTDK